MEGRTRAGPRAGRWRKGAPFRVTLLVLLVTPLAGGILGHWAAGKGGLPPPLTTYPAAPTAASTWDLVISAIYVNPDLAGYGWADCPWVNGSGTPGDPYRLANVTINGGGTKSCIEIRNSMAYFRVENLTCTNAGGFKPAGIKLVNAGNGTLYNNTCTGLSGAGMYLDTTENLTLSWNNCSWNDAQGVYLANTFNLTFTGNNCTGNDGTGILGTTYPANHTFTGNVIVGNVQGLSLGGISNVTITGNTIANNGEFGTRLTNFQNATVSGNTCPGNGMYFYGGGNTTVSGNTCPGSQYGLSLDKVGDITFTTNDWGANGIYWVEENAAGSLVRVQSVSLGPDNLVAGKPVRVLRDIIDPAVPGDAGQVILVNCNATRLEGWAVPIELFHCHDVVLHDNAPITAVVGIVVSWSENVTISGNNCTGAVLHGMDVMESWNVTATGNNCSGVPGQGVRVSNGGNHTVEDNQCLGTGTQAVGVWSATNVTVSGNNCSGPGEKGISLSGGQNHTVTGNNCSGHVEDGLYLYDSHNATLDDNTCGYNAHAGIYLWEANDTVLSGNWLGANPTGLLVQESENVTATGTTFWKSATYAFDLDGKTHDSKLLASTISKAPLDAYRDLGTNNQVGPITHVGLPEAQAPSGPLTVLAGESLTLSGNALNGTTPYTYAWTPGDGTPALPGQAPSHSYAATGTFTATLTVTDADGDVDQDTVQVHVVVDLQPTASATASNSTPVPGDAVTFTATATGGNGPLTYAWDWGDATPAGSGATTTHAFATAGTYTVTLTVIDADGDAVTATLTITVTAPANTGDQDPGEGNGDNDIGTPLSTVVFVVGGCVAIIFITNKTRRKIP